MGNCNSRKLSLLDAALSRSITHISTKQNYNRDSKANSNPDLNPFTSSYPYNIPARNPPLHHLNMVPNYSFLLFSGTLTIRPCIINSLEPAVPGHICTSARIVHWHTYTSDRTERVSLTPGPNHNANAISILHLCNAGYIKIAKNCANTVGCSKMKPNPYRNYSPNHDSNHNS